MLKIGTFNTHANGSCEVDNTAICSFDANLHGDMVGNMSINSLTIENFVENIDVIKADFCAFIDNIAKMVILPEEEENIGEEETPLV